MAAPDPAPPAGHDGRPSRMPIARTLPSPVNTRRAKEKPEGVNDAEVPQDPVDERVAPMQTRGPAAAQLADRAGEMEGEP